MYGGPVRYEVVHVPTDELTAGDALKLNALVEADPAIEGRVTGEEVVVVIDWAEIEPELASKIHSESDEIV